MSVCPITYLFFLIMKASLCKIYIEIFLANFIFLYIRLPLVILRDHRHFYYNDTRITGNKMCQLQIFQSPVYIRATFIS